MAWVAKSHSAHPVPTPCYVQGRQPADQAAQSHIQPGLECLQGWGIHSLLGQPVQCVTTLWVKNFLLISNLNLPCLSLKPFPLVLSLSTLINSHSSPFVCSLQVLKEEYASMKDISFSPREHPHVARCAPCALLISILY